MYHQPNASSQSDLDKSNNDFVQYVWPIVQSTFGDVKLVNLENEPSELAKILDIEAGCDYLVYAEGKGVRGLSTRIQWCEVPYGSFTIRSSRPKSGFETEQQKKSRPDSFIVAGITIQSYLSSVSKSHLATGLIRTSELMRFLLEHPDKVYHKENKDGSSGFEFVIWREIQEAGFSMKVIR